MIYIVTQYYDGSDVKECETVQVAERFCTEFMQKNADYGGHILLVVEGGVRLTPSSDITIRLR